MIRFSGFYPGVDVTEQAARFIGSIPENYDEHLGPHIFAEFAADLARRVANLHPLQVLELAAGTGILTRCLRDVLASRCEILASDLNPPMLDVARKKFASGEQVGFEPADATELAFRDATFDVVTCQFGVMFFPDKGRSYSEVFRVLKSGGSYVFNVWDAWAENPFAEIAHRTVEKFFPDDPPGFYEVPFSYHDKNEICDAVSKAGFVDIRAEHVPLRATIISPMSFARGLVFGNPLHEEIVTRGGDPDLVFAAVTEAIDRGLGAEMPLRALVIHATKS